MMYSAKQLATNETLVLYSERKSDGEKVEVRIRCVGRVEPEDAIYMQFYNLVVRKCLYGMKLEEMGRNFFDRHAAIDIPSHRLTLWPGFVTSMRMHEQDIMLCVEVTHKVLRLDNVLFLINGLRANRDFRKAVHEEIVGTIVMTSYNRSTYHVDDIEWDISPKDTFDLKGSPITYAEYYETRYQTKITDMNQPMLVVRPRKKDQHKGYTGPVYLVPETCQMTGLSDAMRANFGLMKDLSKHLHMPPAERVNAVSGFMKRLLGTETVHIVSHVHFCLNE
jgi:aubergine-like protein